MRKKVKSSSSLSWNLILFSSVISFLFSYFFRFTFLPQKISFFQFENHFWKTETIKIVVNSSRASIVLLLPSFFSLSLSSSSWFLPPMLILLLSFNFFTLGIFSSPITFHDMNVQRYKLRSSPFSSSVNFWFIEFFPATEINPFWNLTHSFCCETHPYYFLPYILPVPPVVEPFTFQTDLVASRRAGVACIVSAGDLPIKINWFKDGRPLDDALGATITTTDFMSFLSFQRVSRAHNGNYSCQAVNHAGVSSASALMLVQGTSFFFLFLSHCLSPLC